MNALKEDLLSGVQSIADYIGEDKQVAQRLITKGEIPAFKKGRKVFARKSEIDAAFRNAA
ncbi:MAG: helix-turn-helix domain-containing protein [Sphingomonadales bacterium]|nr:helix-turn-helix domain-containing protein [Sphingomonadales bacterium]